MEQWLAHHIPFAALMVAPAPPNRPLLTRIVEQSLIAIAAAALTLWVQGQRNADAVERLTEEIKTIKSERRDDNRRIEDRLTELAIQVASKIPAKK